MNETMPDDAPEGPVHVLNIALCQMLHQLVGWAELFAIPNIFATNHE
jgi:hypothetical protein